ncbi:MAG: Protein translocase subunit SecF [Microgenomates group bacterium GW2011_GWA1_48_10]|nr:MAG: Protein translocase subunit SecF [Microgenomates group bacterium GW2011_GWA1_48_10]
MFNIMRFKYLFFAISLLVIIPGIISLALFGLRPSIDFTGGTLLELQGPALKNQTDIEKIKETIQHGQVEVASIQPTGSGTYLFRTKAITPSQKDKILADINKQLPGTKDIRFETVGPTVGKELTIKAVQSVALASVAIVLYIAYAFRQVPKPYSPWKFGIAAVVALLHDVLVVVGIFSILGHLFAVEIDALFVTALLTIIGFSVHDTIVVFDRIRENLQKYSGKQNFEQIVNESLLETLGRSLTTSLTVLFTLLALILFGGQSIRWFVVALFVGVFSGTYSSIFNAAPLLVLWEKK